MKSTLFLAGAFFANAFFLHVALADEPARLLPPIMVFGGDQKGDKDPGKKPDKDKQPPEKKKTPEAAPPDVFSNLLVPRSEARATFNPNMMGDINGIFVRQTITIFGTQTVTTSLGNGSPPPSGGTTITTQTVQTREVLIHDPSRGGYKVAENASPMPRDRVYGAYNYYNGLRGPGSGSTTPVTITQTVTTNDPNRQLPTTTTTTNTITIPGTPYVNLHREIFGFEKTFFDGQASIEVRIPTVQQSSSVGNTGFGGLGDVTIIGKYAFILDRATGDVFSGGLAVTAPTGRSIDSIGGQIHSTLLQPWFGYIWNADRIFVQGFHSIVVPTDARDVTLLFNDVGVGYWLYRGDGDRALSFVVPAFEVHVTTPLNQRSGNGPIFVPDVVNLTGGIHVGIFRNATLSIGVAAPITGPRLFGVEAFTQFNVRF